MDPRDFFNLIDNGVVDEVIRILTVRPEWMELTDQHSHWTPLHCAVWSGKTRIVEWLLEQGANIHALDVDGYGLFSILALTQSNRCVKIAEKLLAAGVPLNIHERYGITPLHIATSRANYELVEFFLSRGAQLDADSEISGTPVHVAAANGNIVLLEMFTAQNENYLHITNRCGRTPLHRAANNGRMEAVEYLVNKGADVNARDNNGETPLLASRTGDVIKFLLSRGADICAVDERGYSILHHMAGSWYHPKTLKTIFDYGPDTSRLAKINGKEVTAREIAQRNGFTTLVKMIDEYDSFPTVKGALEEEILNI